MTVGRPPDSDYHLTSVIDIEQYGNKCISSNPIMISSDKLPIQAASATSFVNNRYRITRRIGGGSFGEIYLGIGPNEEKV